MAPRRLAALVSLGAALLLAGCEARPAPAPADARVTRTATLAAAGAPASEAGRAGESPQFARNVDEAMATLHREHEGD